METSDMTTHYLPKIWLGDFRTKAEYEEQAEKLGSAYSIFDWIDDRLIYSRHPFRFPAYCSSCKHVTQMRIDWLFGGGSNEHSSIHPAWTETATCEECGLNSRMRALIEFLQTRIDITIIQKAFIAEQVTPLFQNLKKLIPCLIGSEYLGSKYKKGQIVVKWKDRRRIRHEDLTDLSFLDGEFDLVMTLDVFEHISNYQKVFYEINRVLVSGGHLVFTIPFFFDLETTRIRASIGKNGITHHLPKEIHGNPLSDEGSLCFQNFGWDILQDLRNAGFADSIASLYWGPWQGHLGFPFFIFSATK
jgi:SAM-dependent methyltransferase